MNWEYWGWGPRALDLDGPDFTAIQIIIGTGTMGMGVQNGHPQLRSSGGLMVKSCQQGQPCGEEARKARKRAEVKCNQRPLRLRLLSALQSRANSPYVSFDSQQTYHTSWIDRRKRVAVRGECDKNRDVKAGPLLIARQRDPEHHKRTCIC